MNFLVRVFRQSYFSSYSWKKLVLLTKNIMSFSKQKLAHYVLVPFFAPGHMIPMIDLGRMLASRGVHVSVVTTPLNTARCKAVIDRAEAAGLPIRLAELRFPCSEAGLPEGCESIDRIPTIDLVDNFFTALTMLCEPLLFHLRQQQPWPKPSCLIYDNCVLWTTRVARELGVPQLVFEAQSGFFLMCTHIVSEHKPRNPPELFEPFPVPGLPDKIEVVRAQSYKFFDQPGFDKYRNEWMEAQSATQGAVINSFRELEAAYIDGYEKAVGKKVWAVGPLALSYRDAEEKAARGDRPDGDGVTRVMSWLDAKDPESVIYVNFGSLVRHSASHLFAIGVGLEASSKAFVWVMKREEASPEVEAWLAEGFEERTRERGLILKGWAPQMLILAHPSLGGFMTHCGWNSTLEAVSAGLPMVTWPHLWDQFLNEKLVVEVLRIGVALKPNTNITFISQRAEGLIEQEDVDKAVRKLMDGEEMRERAKELARKANQAVREGGSSYKDLTLMIRHVAEQLRSAQ